MNHPVRAAMLARLGAFPPPAPLDWQADGEERRDDIRYTRVAYTLAPGERVWAWLLRPTSGAATPLPGILAIHQHAGQFYLGKAEPAGLAGEPMYHYGLELARRGYAVLCPDLLGFEDRRPPEYERVANPGAAGDGGYERWLAVTLLAQGSSLQARYLSDLGRALDVLAAQPDVDPTRLGCIGHSLGGQETVWLAWYDARIRAAVASCGVGLISTIIRDRVGHNMALWVPGLLTVGDMDSVVAGVAPRPLLLIQADSDRLFPIDGVHHLGRVAQHAYADQGCPDHFGLTLFSGGHSFPIEMRKAAYNWLDRWLRGATRTKRAPELQS